MEPTEPAGSAVPPRFGVPGAAGRHLSRPRPDGRRHAAGHRRRDGESTSNPHHLATTGSPAGPLSIAGAALLLAGILLLLVLRKRRVGDES
ncbi:LPXTG-motif cell wall anchor domain-containing protein/MYXO-CTERM domain-containing protein [Saccharopolyspora shandongensis]|uniref:LPXTG-motif cell wall anchor domain-containing protein/MYXO-CTERM domain-containing protein n=1 Tax=Saccharopolyspora shandongensis TaxID=418495 RepID=A0A1H3H7T4_9PSEU|nr:LPXTG cell wall anchor domain-containing protein [Saccharopolyspora shandongensis]SDY10958.1 LPXTG-motif cell wall anchor domain-containing protein/MYXO-CTERM domain-containing protein [Saccharopolyspora shandongensis]